MTEDPSRLLSQESDAFATSLLRSARDGDRDAARVHKAAVLGAAGGAAAGGAALAAATRLSARGLFATLGGKWALAALVTLGGLGLGAALLTMGPPAAPNAGAPPSMDLRAPASPDTPSTTAPQPAATDRASNEAPSPPQPGAPPAADTAPAVAADVASPSPATPHDPADPSDTAGRSRPTSPAPARDAKPATTAAASAPSASAEASPSGATPGLAEEVAALRAAHEALGKGQSQRCLDAVNAYFAAFPSGHLSAEARYLRVEALFAGGQRAQASSLARGMLTANPRSPYAARLRTIAGDPAP